MFQRFLSLDALFLRSQQFFLNQKVLLVDRDELSLKFKQLFFGLLQFSLLPLVSFKHLLSVFERSDWQRHHARCAFWRRDDVCLHESFHLGLRFCFDVAPEVVRRLVVYYKRVSWHLLLSRFYRVICLLVFDLV